jgi:uncharacterized protein Yka (UPF0111/DUF47 family)
MHVSIHVMDYANYLTNCYEKLTKYLYNYLKLIGTQEKQTLTKNYETEISSIREKVSSSLVTSFFLAECYIFFAII